MQLEALKMFLLFSDKSSMRYWCEKGGTLRRKYKVEKMRMWVAGKKVNQN